MAKVEIWRLDRLMAVASLDAKGGLSLEGPGTAQAGLVLGHFSEEASGEELLALLLRRLRGRWWARPAPEARGHCETTDAVSVLTQPVRGAKRRAKP